MSNTELLLSVNDPNTEPINDCITKVIYSITEDEDDDNSSIPSYLVGGLDLVLYTDDEDEDDSDNSTIPSYLVDGLDLDLHSESDWDSEEDEEDGQTTKLNDQ